MQFDQGLFITFCLFRPAGESESQQSIRRSNSNTDLHLHLHSAQQPHLHLVQERRTCNQQTHQIQQALPGVSEQRGATPVFLCSRRQRAERHANYTYANYTYANYTYANYTYAYAYNLKSKHR